MKSYVIDKLIDSELLVQYGEMHEMCASEKEIQDNFNDLKTSFSSSVDYEKALKNIGLDENSLLEDIKSQLIIDKVIEAEITPFINKVDDSVVEKIYEEQKENFRTGPAVNASHIFIKVNNFDNTEEVSESKKKIDEIYSFLKNGYDFESMAKQYSECKSSERGGDLGTFTYDEIDEDFASVVFDLNPGKFSKPFASDSGFHIALVKKLITEYVPDFNSVKGKLKEYLVSLLESEVMENFLEKLRNEAKIELFEY